MRAVLRFSLKATLPIFFGYLALGIAFGILLQEAGYSWLWALGISLTVYAGSMQFVLVGFLAAGASLLTVALLTALVNCRHIFYGLSLLERFRGQGLRRPYLIFALTDETYSLLCGMEPPPELDRGKVDLCISALDHSYWILGSVIGCVAGQLIPFDMEGVDFAMTALFVVIFVEQWQSGRSRPSALVGLVSGAVFLILLGPDSFILPSLLVTVGALLLLRPRLERRAAA